MTDDTLIADLIRAGLSPELVQRVVNALSGTSPGQVRDIVRKYESDRKSTWRQNRSVSNDVQLANDVCTNTEKSPGHVPDAAQSSSYLLTSKSLKEGIREVKKEPKSQSKAQAKRGYRLSSEVQISDEQREFAFELGFDDAQTKKIWAEFVDYWSEVPGQRGVKLSWMGTWRNRCRAVADRKPNGTLQVFPRNEPRRGSRDDTRERLVKAMDQLHGFAESESFAHEQADGGEVGQAPIGRLPKPQCA